MDASPPKNLFRRLASLAERVAREPAGTRGDWLTRFVVLRLLGLVYLMAFLTLANQGPALLGPHGLLPVNGYLDAVAGALGSRGAGFRALPSVFWLGAGDGASARCGLGGRRAGDGGAARLRQRDPAGDPVRAADLDRQRRADVLRLRLGDPARRDGVPLHLPVSACWTDGRFRAGRRRRW